jgi:hypothetical protein
MVQPPPIMFFCIWSFLSTIVQMQDKWKKDHYQSTTILNVPKKHLSILHSMVEEIFARLIDNISRTSCYGKNHSVKWIENEGFNQFNQGRQCLSMLFTFGDFFVEVNSKPGYIDEYQLNIRTKKVCIDIEIIRNYLSSINYTTSELQKTREQPRGSARTIWFGLNYTTISAETIKNILSNDMRTFVTFSNDCRSNSANWRVSKRNNCRDDQISSSSSLIADFFEMATCIG